jgi:peptidoglycan/xylan/chitin deacetylase (PgdA/CDA1 family)
LADYHLEATVFLVAGMCGGSAQWRGQPQALRSSELLDWSKIAELQRAGIRFGAHTLTHPRLTSIEFEDACREISDSKKRIEDRTGEPVAAFAYPYGAESQRLQSYVRENFEVGCSTRLGYLNARSKPESLERIDVHYLRDLFWFRRLFRRSTGAYLASRGLMRSWKHSLLGPS